MHHYENPQENVILEKINQGIGSMLKTKDMGNVTFDAVAPRREIIVSIEYEVLCSYHIMLQSTP